MAAIAVTQPVEVIMVVSQLVKQVMPDYQKSKSKHILL